MSTYQKTAFAAGCFWGIEHKLRQIPGVVDAISGYMNGDTQSPTYKDVCSGTTGHAEAVEVTFNPDEVSFDQLLDAFWAMHDPTQINRQGPDTGTQYRSGIFYYADDQKERAENSRSEAQKRFPKPIATEITKADVFWKAEEYHQRYVEKQGGSACAI